LVVGGALPNCNKAAKYARLRQQWVEVEPRCRKKLQCGTWGRALRKNADHEAAPTHRRPRTSELSYRRGTCIDAVETQCFSPPPCLNPSLAPCGRWPWTARGGPRGWRLSSSSWVLGRYGSWLSPSRSMR